MNWPSDLRTQLTIIQIGGFLFLLSKIFLTGLWRTYRYFSWYIAFESIRLPFMASLNVRTNLYAQAYFVTQPIVWILLVLVVFEVFHLVLRNHAGIATLGRKALATALFVSTGVSASTLFFDWQQNSSKHFILDNFMLLERLVMTSLLVLLLCLIAFLAYFPVPLARNIRVHASIFSFYFAARTSLLWVRTFFGLEHVAAVNLAIAVLAILCLFAWAILLSRAGETLAPAQRPSSDSEARLLSQLESLNETLIGSSRK